MDPRVDIYKAALSHQTGAGFDFSVYKGRSQFRISKPRPIRQGIGDVFCGIWRFCRPVAMKGAQSLLKAGGEALKDGATVKKILTNMLKLSVGTVLATTAEQVANHFLADKPTAAPGPAPTIGPPPGALMEPLQPQTGSGKRHSVYKLRPRPPKRSARYVQPYSNFPIRYNC